MHCLWVVVDDYLISLFVVCRVLFVVFLFVCFYSSFVAQCLFVVCSLLFGVCCLLVGCSAFFCLMLFVVGCCLWCVFCSL